MSTAGIKNIIEALLFASEEELPLKSIKDILEGFKIKVSIAELEKAIEELNEEYKNNDNAFEIIRIAGGYQFATKSKFAHFIGKLTAETQRKKLSQSAIETLSIIAYKQPITRTEIEFIRGVNVDYIVNSLLERDLISIKGRADGPGRPILYGTTATFLKVLGLNSLDELPKLKEINEILKNEKIDGITEADIDLFNSMSTAEVNSATETTGQLNFEDSNTQEKDNIKEQEETTVYGSNDEETIHEVTEAEDNTEQSEDLSDETDEKTEKEDGGRE